MVEKIKFDKVVLLHAWGSNPEQAFFPWLKKELENEGLQVKKPILPNAENPDFDEWLAKFEKLNISENTLVVGRSLGGTLALAAALKGNKIGKLIAVCTPLENNAIPEFFKKIGNWDFEKIKNNIQKTIIFQSTNDPYVPQKDAERLSKKLNAPLIKIENVEHFAGEKYPKILEEIKKSLY